MTIAQERKEAVSGMIGTRGGYLNRDQNCEKEQTVKGCEEPVFRQREWPLSKP